MKKILMITLAALLLFSLAACAAPSAPDSGTAQESAAPSQEAAAPSDGGQTPSDEKTSQAVQLLGKVKSMVGNEISLDLAKLAGDETPEGGEGEEGATMAPAQSITVTTDEGESAGGESGGEEAPKVGYYAADGSGNVTAIGGGDDMPKLELEYTGETKDISVPAGIQIFDLFGKEMKIADLKEGNVLMVSMRPDGSLDLITVME